MTADLYSAVSSERSRASILRYLLIAGLALNVIGVFSSVAQHSLLASIRDGVEVSAQRADANDGRQAMIGIAQIVVFLATAIVWLFWLHRAYANLRLVGSRKTELTPGWAVGYWFIPFVNLVRPYLTTAELWRRSAEHNARELPVAKAPSLIGGWWIIYLGTGALGRTFSSLMRNAKTASDYITATDIGMVGDAVGVVSCILAIMVVQGIDRFQSEFATAAHVPA